MVYNPIMRIPQDFEYTVHRPGDPKTHSLGNGFGASKNAALGAMKLAKEWLRQVPVIGIQVTRFKIFILISQEGSSHGINDFHERTQKKLEDHAVIRQTPEYLDQQIASFPAYETSIPETSGSSRLVQTAH